MTLFAQAAFDALGTACVYALVAVGFTLVYGVTKVVNVAYGDILAVGAYMAFIIVPSSAVAFVWGFGASVLSVGVLCLLLERFLYRPTYLRPINGFLISLGLVQVIDNVLMYLDEHYPPRGHPALRGVWHVHGLFLPDDSILVIAGTIVILVGLMVFLERTRSGLAVRAVANDRELAAMMGVPVTRLVSGVFFLVGVLAGAGGAFVGLTRAGSLTFGASLLVRGLVAALVGGLGSVRGALIAALSLATLEAVVEWSLAPIHLVIWLDPIEFGLAVLLLVFRPKGLIGGVTSPIESGRVHQSSGL